MTAPSSRRDALVLLGCLVLGIGWAIALHGIQGADVYAFLGPLAAATALAMLAVRGVHRERRALLRGLAIGAAVGVAMTAATYAIYALLAPRVPGLAVHVVELYAAAKSERLGPALAWTSVAIVAEELLWRGALLESATARFGQPAAIALSLATYTAVQIASGSWVTALAALLCGAVWTAERVWTGTLVASLVSHAIWTITVIHLAPVTGR